MPRTLLREYPPAIQLFIFMIIWLICQLLTAGVVIPALVTLTTNKDITISAFQEQPDLFPATAIWINLIGSTLLFLAPSFIFSIIISSNPTGFIGFKMFNAAKILLWVMLVGIAMVFVLPDLSDWLQKAGFGSWADKLQKEREQQEAIYFRDKSTLGLLRNILLLALVPAFCEEVFFRGVLQRLVYMLSSHKLLAILATSILFALVHNSIYNFIPIFIAGIILGHVYFQTGSLWTNILLHFVYNMVQIIVVHATTSDQDLLTDSAPAKIIITIASVIIILISLRMIHKYRTPINLSELKAGSIRPL